MSYHTFEMQKQRRDQFAALVKTWNKCAKCEISNYAKKKVHFRGVLPCDLLFVGEAPGKTEDVLGVPFVGRAGRLLNAWVADVACSYAIINLVACRPTDSLGGGNRESTVAEQTHCVGRFMGMIQFAKPKAVVVMGKPAKKHSELFTPYGKLPVLFVPHPAYILRMGGISSQKFADEKKRIEKFARKHGGA